MKSKFLALALAAFSVVASQAGLAEAGFGCRTYNRYSYHPVTVVHRPTVVVQPTTPSPLVVALPAPTPPTIVVPAKAIKVPQGGVLRLKANFLGNQTGQVFLATGSVTLACEIVEWNPSFVIVHLPDMAVVNEIAAKIVIVTNEGTLKRKVDVIVVPTPDVEVVANDEFIPKAPTEVLGN